MPVPHPTDESEANALPDPELNPLLNPLLAAHMGRWAEVYFTNPPEKRERAVSELLRELENASPPAPASVQVIDDERWKRKNQMAEAPDLSPATAEYLRICSACAYNNSAGQRFCGMCGAPLQILPEAQIPPVAEAVPISGASWSEHEPSPDGNSVEYAIEPSGSSAGGTHEARERFWPLRGKDLLDIGAESEPVRYRYRLYVGVVLAILVAVGVYMAWRGTEALSGVTAPQSASSAQAIPPAQSVPAASAQQASATRSTLPGGDPTASVQSQANAREDQAADAQAAPRIVPVAAGSTGITSEPGGAEEFATAMKYLNGNPGVTRDSREAAQWLWKAVGKGNLAATMALSDLYLRGDGVPKSCDQARLLLDAAARKGGTAAAALLRNLQAFGCE
jgi:Sel1 repeat-containing protein